MSFNVGPEQPHDQLPGTAANEDEPGMRAHAAKHEAMKEAEEADHEYNQRDEPAQLSAWQKFKALFSGNR